MALRLLVLIVLLWLVPQAHARRIALVVGNDTYAHAEKLRNARSDAQAFGRALTAAGFQVTLVQDASREQLLAALDRFVAAVTKDDEVVFYFAGHGVQIDAAPYLLPVDIRPDSARQVGRDALALDTVMADLGKARYGLVIVDACRNNPFSAPGRRSLGGDRGLLPVEPPEGLAVMLSAGRGQTALDSLGPADRQPNGLFTRELIKAMEEPGITVRDLLLKVRDSVEQLAATVQHKQRPALIDESRGQFHFHPPRPGVAPAAAQLNEQLQVEIAFWSSVQERGGLDELQMYLRRYPQGQFAELAQARVARLQPAAAASGPARPASAAAAPEAPAGVSEVARARALADRGNAAAMVDLANWYLSGRHGLPRDAKEALRWLKPAVDLGHPGAMAGLGVLYERGLAGLPRDAARALELYRRSAELGDARGMNNLGAAHENGLGGAAPDYAQALHWYRKAADAGYARSITNVGRMYASGRGVAQVDMAVARQWYERAAAALEPMALTLMGNMHAFGRADLPKDEARALQLYRQAADLGEPLAMLSIGYAYANGRGVARDDAAAVSWIRKAVDAGHARAVSELGYFHASGRGVPQDWTKAVAYYRRGVELEDVLSMNNLADLMADAKGGLAKDERAALALYRRGAELASSYSMNMLGIFHRDGRGGLTRDVAQARVWFTKAADLGHPAALGNLQALR